MIKKRKILLLFGIFLSMVLGSSCFRDHVSEAQSYLEIIIPMLDEYKIEHGVYPESLTSINVEKETLKDKPKLIVNPILFHCQHESLLNTEEKTILTDLDRNYRSDGIVYELCFHSQDSFDTTGTVSVYYSERKSWGTRVSYGRWEIGQGISSE